MKTVRPHSQEANALTVDDVLPGRCFEANKRRNYATMDGTFYDDRQVAWVSSDRTRVQYDSPMARPGRRLPVMNMEKFLKWAGKDVSALMPRGKWREVK